MSISSLWQQKNEVDVCVTDVLRYTLIFVALAGLILYFVFSFRVVLFFLLGAVFSIANFIFLRYQLEFITRAYMQGGKTLLPVVMGYVLRFLMMGIFLYLCGMRGIDALLSAGFGLVTIRIGIFFYGIFGIKDCKV